MSEGEQNLKEQIAEIRELLSDDKKKKDKKHEFKIPRFAQVKGRKAKENYVTIFKLNENNNIDVKSVQIKEQTFWEDDIPRLASAGYIYYYKKIQ